LDSTTAMGNDGGSIPDRRDLVKSKAKAEQADKANQILAKWFFCALSKRPLEEPTVSCALGKLYNKDAILEYLIDKAAYGDGEAICGHIRSLKDIVTLKLTPNPAPVVPGVDVRSRAAYVCPLTLKEMTGALPFVYLSTCGCVFSASGLRALAAPATDVSHGEESKHTPTSCPQCSKPYEKKTDVLTINPSDEEEATMRAAMETKRGAAKLQKQSGKGKKRKAGEMEKANQESTINGHDSKRQRNSMAPAPKTNAAVAVMTRKVAESLAEEELKRKTVMSGAVASLYGPKEKFMEKKETFMTMGTFTRYA